VVTAEWPESLDGWRHDLLHSCLANLLPDGPAASQPVAKAASGD
jgi:hypothetical protein